MQNAPAEEAILIAHSAKARQQLKSGACARRPAIPVDGSGPQRAGLGCFYRLGESRWNAPSLGETASAANAVARQKTIRLAGLGVIIAPRLCTNKQIPTCHRQPSFGDLSSSFLQMQCKQDIDNHLCHNSCDYGFMSGSLLSAKSVARLEGLIERSSNLSTG